MGQLQAFCSVPQLREGFAGSRAPQLVTMALVTSQSPAGPAPVWAAALLLAARADGAAEPGSDLQAAPCVSVTVIKCISSVLKIKR